MKPNPIPLLSAYRMGDQIHIQFGPTIPDQTVCAMQVAQALMWMACNSVVQEHKEKSSIAVAPAGMRVARSD